MKEVMVKITTNQVNEQGEEDIMEFVTEAKLYKRGEAVYLIYEETEKRLEEMQSDSYELPKQMTKTDYTVIAVSVIVCIGLIIACMLGGI